MLTGSHVLVGVIPVLGRVQCDSVTECDWVNNIGPGLTLFFQKQNYEIKIKIEHKR